MMNLSELKGKRFSVLGAARSGLASARFLNQHDASVFVSDGRAISQRIKDELYEMKIEFEEGAHTDSVLSSDLIIVSPGIPFNTPILIEARSRGIYCLSEIELAFHFSDPARIIAVTGSLGKTTTTYLISALLDAHGHEVVMAGNIGTPWIEVVNQAGPNAITVLEVSSYQLEHVQNFRPHIGLLTRFSPHHLERHGSIEHYFSLKQRLFQNQTPNDYAILLEGNPEPPNLASQLTIFSPNIKEVSNLDIAPHQKENLAGALVAARCINQDVVIENIELEQVFKLPHRIEFVQSVDGVEFYNDSKATTPDATLAALRSFNERKVILALGGSDTEVNHESLIHEIGNQDLAFVFLMGDSAGRLAKLLDAHGFHRHMFCNSHAELIQRAIELNPDICLYSPAAPSFDRFKSYIDRGESFREALASFSS